MSGAAEAGRAFIRLIVKDHTRNALRNAMRRFRLFSSSLKVTRKQLTLSTAAAVAFKVAMLGVATAVTAAMVAIAGVTALGVIFTGRTIKAAADMQETMNAFNETFRESADAVRDWAAQFSVAMGRSRKVTIESLTSFQAFLVGLGLGPRHSKEMSKSLVRLATDFGSFRNLTDDESVQRFMSALAGEPERLRRFGINIGEAAVNLKLMAMGFPRVQQGATELQKVLARYVIIGETMSRQNAIGDAARTAGTFVNQAKKMKGILDEIKFSIGDALLPAATELLRITNDWLGSFSDKASGLTGFASLLEGVAKDFGVNMEVAASNWQLAFEIGTIKIKMGLLEMASVVGNALSDAIQKVLETVGVAIDNLQGKRGVGRGSQSSVEQSWQRFWGQNPTEAHQASIDSMQRIYMGYEIATTGVNAAWDQLQFEMGRGSGDQARFSRDRIFSRQGWSEMWNAAGGLAREVIGDQPMGEGEGILDIAARMGDEGFNPVADGMISDLENQQRLLMEFWRMEQQRIRDEQEARRQQRQQERDALDQESFFDPSEAAGETAGTEIEKKGKETEKVIQYSMTKGANTAQLSSAMGLLGKDMNSEVRQQTVELKKANKHLEEIERNGGAGMGS